MKLLIDAGNSRLKWAFLHDTDLRDCGAAPLDRIAPSLPEPMLAAGAPEGISVCNVAGPRVAAVLRGELTKRFGVGPQFVTATALAHGVRNAYARPEQLGADRWCAMVGAFAEYGGPVCVVDAGTACTIDVIAADGGHLGGLLVPGLALMSDALRARTSDLTALESAEPAGDAGTLANNTAGAMREGPRGALAALVERTAERLERRLGTALHVVITGGEAQQLRDALERDATYNPVLVLRGLAEFARGTDA